MRNKPKYYSREDKLHYLKLFYESGMSKSAFCRAHEIYNASVLNVWIKKYEKEASLVTLPSEEPLNPTDVMANRSKENYKDENAQLKKRIKELEKALAYSRLETEARDLMIDIAKKNFSIPIRKKLGPNSNGTGKAAQSESCACLPSVWPLPSNLLPVNG